MDQDSLEGEYGERMRRVNDDLRVAKARCVKYKQIHAELESQLAQEQSKVRDLTDKHRALKEKLRAISALGGNEDTPFDPTKYKENLEERDCQITKLEHDIQVLKKANEAQARRQQVKAKHEASGKDHYKEQAQMLEEELERKLREGKENQVLIRKLQSQMRRMKLEITSLQKLNHDRIKLGAIMGEAPIETPDIDYDDDVQNGTFLTHLGMSKP